MPTCWCTDVVTRVTRVIQAVWFLYQVSEHHFPVWIFWSYCRVSWAPPSWIVDMAHSCSSKSNWILSVVVCSPYMAKVELDLDLDHYCSERYCFSLFISAPNSKITKMDLAHFCTQWLINILKPGHPQPKSSGWILRNNGISPAC